MTLEERIAVAARVLIGCGAREVYVFGSAALGKMDPHSDVDLAVTGLDPAQYFRAYALAHEALGLPLDLVDLDQENPFTRCLRDLGDLVRVA